MVIGTVSLNDSAHGSSSSYRRSEELRTEEKSDEADREVLRIVCRLGAAINSRLYDLHANGSDCVHRSTAMRRSTPSPGRPSVKHEGQSSTFGWCYLGEFMPIACMCVGVGRRRTECCMEEADWLSSRYFCGRSFLPAVWPTVRDGASTENGDWSTQRLQWQLDVGVSACVCSFVSRRLLVTPIVVFVCAFCCTECRVQGGEHRSHVLVSTASVFARQST
ncbi:uncharacterized protein C8Q71DRAFT_130178 [Rhodofomes roseus]|uniref:Uncharacterized protein n=1 Tax=Rhodofomes roseus TaxID=34475 RepID=A0ABQ8KCR9_9APHY|nr:uncharacterized protein C8Q71DRAFT_130178 [Rhodofomes roseus]KAH9834895.1 hypothetical protein C8Q71DRAFT_130178 [Rhodofomes roseus]